MIREQIYAALFSFFSGLTAGATPLFVTATRELKTWNNFQPEACPAICMQQALEDAQYTRGLLTKWQGRVKLYVLVYTGQGFSGGAPQTAAQQLNALLDQIEQAIAPLTPDAFAYDQDGVQTLQGLVSHVAIEGTIEYWQGDEGNEAVAVVPITFLVANTPPP